MGVATLTIVFTRVIVEEASAKEASRVEAFIGIITRVPATVEIMLIGIIVVVVSLAEHVLNVMTPLIRIILSFAETIFI